MSASFRFVALVGSREARDFARVILKGHEEQHPTNGVIRRYPQAHEDEILELLIDLLAVRNHRMETEDRLERDQFDWLVEAYSSDLKNATRKTQALGMMDASGDPRTREYLILALDDPSDRVRYAGVLGLKRLTGTLGSRGYSWEEFQREEQEVIAALKALVSESR